MADLTCQELVELVTDYLEGALDDASRRRFEQHLAVCAGCDVYLQQMKEIAAMLGKVSVETLSDEMQSTLLSAFRDFRR